MGPKQNLGININHKKISHYPTLWIEPNSVHFLKAFLYLKLNDIQFSMHLSFDFSTPVITVWYQIRIWWSSDTSFFFKFLRSNVKLIATTFLEVINNSSTRGSRLSVTSNLHQFCVNYYLQLENVLIVQRTNCTTRHYCVLTNTFELIPGLDWTGALRAPGFILLEILSLHLFVFIFF